MRLVVDMDRLIISFANAQATESITSTYVPATLSMTFANAQATESITSTYVSATSSMTFANAQATESITSRNKRLSQLIYACLLHCGF